MKLFSGTVTKLATGRQPRAYLKTKGIRFSNKSNEEKDNNI